MHERTKSVTGDEQSQRLSFSFVILVLKVAPTPEARVVTFPYIRTDHKVSPFVPPFTGITFLISSPLQVLDFYFPVYSFTRPTCHVENFLNVLRYGKHSNIKSDGEVEKRSAKHAV